MTEKRDVQKDFNQTAERIARIPCQDSTIPQVLAELSRWNTPGKAWDKVILRFLANYNLQLSGQSWSNNPTAVLFRTAKAMMAGSDKVQLGKAHWSEAAINPRWQVYPKTRILSDNQLSLREYPFYTGLKMCRPGSTRGLIGMDMTYEHLMHSGVHVTVNCILAASAESATLQEVQYIVGASNIVRPIRQNSLNWHVLTTPRARRVAVWTLAVSCSIWGPEFADSFLEFCTAALVGSVCGVTRQECREGFAACVSIATIARARVVCSAGPITNQEITRCTHALWVLGIIENACSSARGTLWASRYMTKSNGERISVKACDKWESPIDNDLNPSNSFFVTGSDCAHPNDANEDGTFGMACGGRWTVVTKLEELEQQDWQDGKMVVTLTHANAPAVNNILAVLERRDQWAYVQGQQECLTCAYKRALRQGFPVIIDSPRSPTVSSAHILLYLHLSANSILLQTAAVARFKRTMFFGATRGLGILIFLFILASLIPHTVAQTTATQYPLEHSIFKPNSTCEHFSGPPVRRAISWTSLVSIIRAFLSVALTIGSIRSGKRFVRRTPFNLVTCLVSTLMAGFSGWIITSGCVGFKTVALMKGLVTASVNRLAYEVIDVLCMVVSVVAVPLTIIYNAPHNPWALLQPAQLTLMFLSISYIWRWLDTGRKQATSRGVVGSPFPLLISHVVALAFAVVTFVLSANKDSTAGVASYVSDGLLLGEALMQFLLLS